MDPWRECARILLPQIVEPPDVVPRALRRSEVRAEDEERAMPWKVTHAPSLHMSEVVFSGKVTGSELRAAASRRISLEKETHCNAILVDASNLELAATLVDVLDLPDRLYTDEEASRQSLIALVQPKSDREKKEAVFYETACRNRGWFVQVFSERQEAIDWLASHAASYGPGTDGA